MNWNGIPVYASHQIGTKAAEAVIVVHGTSRNAVDYYDYVKNVVPPATLIYAPRFETSADGPAATNHYWSSSGWKQGDSSQDAASISSFAVMDALVSAIAADKISIVGHSAGGQFVQRYAAAATDSRIRIVAANPSSYLYLSADRPFPNASCSGFNDYKYGLDNLNPYMASIGASGLAARYNGSKLTYLLGVEDTLEDSDLDTSCAAETQGSDRLVRGRERSARDPSHTKLEISGVGHSGSKMIAGAADAGLLFGSR